MILVFCLVRGITADGLVLFFVWFENRAQKMFATIAPIS
ncbi:hypothetical protein Zm00014a_011145 [Zea mays]|uniref:Uncharacterized protein n=1 Tax=Zea mays TaxID=4577 RepID=A0A317YDL4_MAIZE|nr:hypothetical protein Zm00014a_011145 [Zea mays]